MVTVVVSCCSCSVVRLADDIDDFLKLMTAWCFSAHCVTMSRWVVSPMRVVEIVSRSSTNMSAQMRSKKACEAGMPCGALFSRSSRPDV